MPDNLKYYFWQYNLTDHTTIPQTTPHTKYQPLFFKKQRNFSSNCSISQNNWFISE